LVILDPKPLETASFALNGINSNMYQSGGAHAPTWTHVGQELPSFRSLCKSKYCMFQLFVGSLLVVTSDLAINFATAIHVPHNCSKSLGNQHFKMHCSGEDNRLGFPPHACVAGAASAHVCLCE